MMESYGIIEGMMIHSAIILPAVLAMTYGVGKLMGKFYEDHADKKIMEELPIYALSIPTVLAVINNNYQIFTS